MKLVESLSDVIVSFHRVRGLAYSYEHITKIVNALLTRERADPPTEAQIAGLVEMTCHGKHTRVNRQVVQKHQNICGKN
jgi:hypothetical protein